MNQKEIAHTVTQNSDYPNGDKMRFCVNFSIDKVECEVYFKDIVKVY